MGSSHDHNHTHGANKRTLLISFFLTTAFMITEAVGGFLTNSLALLSDAGHMLSDSISLGVAVLAFILGEKVADYSKTYGYKRFEILAALFNGATLTLIAVYIFYEAYQRLFEPAEIASTGMLIIAILGLLINLLVAWILLKGDTKDNLNLRAAFLHVISDLLGSIGAIIAALLIIFLGWNWADPVASVIVAILVLVSGIRVAKDSIHVLMEGTPKNIEVEDIVSTITHSPEIISVHDLHIWSITSGKNALSCHAVVRSNLSIYDGQKILRELEKKLEKKGIGHVTVQLEGPEHHHEDNLMCDS